MKKIIMLIVGVLATLTLCSCVDTPVYIGEWECYNEYYDFVDTYWIESDGTYKWGCDNSVCDTGTYKCVDESTIVIVSDYDGAKDTLFVDNGIMHSSRWNLSEYNKVD